MTTHWSVVLAVGRSDPTRAMAALEQLCQTYWYPIYAYLRRRGYAEHDAEDLTQGFFATLLRRGALERVVPGRARFRTYLLSVLKNFLVDERDRQRAQKRGGGQEVYFFGAEDAERRYQLEPPARETPEKLFDRRWAMTLTDRALGQLEKEFTARGKADLFKHLHGCLAGDQNALTHAEAAVSLGMTEEAIRKAAQRLRRRYREILREAIGRTVSHRGEIEEELRYLQSVLAGS